MLEAEKSVQNLIFFCNIIIINLFLITVTSDRFSQTTTHTLCIISLVLASG